MLANLVVSRPIHGPSTPWSDGDYIVVAKTVVDIAEDKAQCIALVVFQSDTRVEQMVELGQQFQGPASSCDCDEGEIE